LFLRGVMSEIPFSFFPVPTYFRDQGFFKNPKARLFIYWCFERCSNQGREVFHDGQRIFLKPYQFIFGRRVCSEETGLTEDEVRTQQTTNEAQGFLQKIPNKTPNRFTIYEWSTEAFSKHNPQVNPQQIPNKPPTTPPTNPHNLDIRNKIVRIEEQQQQYTDPRKQHNYDPQTLPPAAAAVFFECLNKIEDPSITIDEKIAITKKYKDQEKVVQDAVEVVISPNFKPNETLLKALWGACKKKLKPNVTKKSAKTYCKQNREFGQLVDDELFQKVRGKGFNCYKAHFAIVTHPSGYQEIEYDQPFSDFVDEIEQKGNVDLHSYPKIAKFLTETGLETRKAR